MKEIMKINIMKETKMKKMKIENINNEIMSSK